MSLSSIGRSLGRASLLLVVVASCSDDPAPASDPPARLLPGETCDNRHELRLSMDPPDVVVAPGATRPVRLTIEPDACDPATARFASADAAVAAAPGEARFDLRHATFDFLVTGGATGRTTITASMDAKDVDDVPYTATVELPIDVRDAAPPTCDATGAAQGTLGASQTALHGQGSLAKAAVSARPEAFTREDEFALPSFPAEIACADDLIAGAPSAKLRKLGPAVTFTARAPLSTTKAMRRDIDFAVPVNPAAFPSGARLRHLTILYSGPRAKAPRPIPVSNARIEADGDDYVLKFASPWFGTYQAAVAEDAGSKRRTRKLTHRAVIGFSMGGGGAAVFGVRHHDMFDAIAPLGGPSDWTWLLWYLEKYPLGGFCPDGQSCPTYAPNRYPLDEPFAHTMDYDHWWSESGSGNGGRFPRSEYIQIFEDLALAMGNGNGWNTAPGLLHMAPGPKPTDPWVKGPDGLDCTYAVEPIKDDPNEQRQRERERACQAWRCDPKNVWKAERDYFDDEYNPDGTKPVIAFCDGNQEGESPYRNTFAPGGTKPVNLALAVDLNGNGVRDKGEPIIRSGHEPFGDCGADGLCDPDEPGYDPETNPDPNQDDYDYVLNPNGLEGNHRWDPGEPWDDVGLDGVPDTASRHVAGDPGEGDGKYSEAPGLTNFYANDPHSMLARRTTAIPGGPITDGALQRVDILTDGGVRDLFNFASVASHLKGQVFGRTGPNGLPLRSVAFYNGFDMLPGQVRGKPDDFSPALLRWADIADMPSVRYGDLDATRQQIEQGDGQHVGKANQLLFRLETAFFYVGQRWPDADRRTTIDARDDAATTTKNELGVECEVFGKCETFFTGPVTKRTGPIAVSLPPGYAQKDNVARDVRYPVLYVLHGYGQDPRDLEAVAIFTNNFMNGTNRSYATRLPKFIIVYVDGRCRSPDGADECIRGTFYMDSARDGGAKMDAWFSEVVDYIDRNYRTMPPSEIEVVD
ncbi:MAG: hypothetical protein KIS78_01125 [Labilithrix sp.]|nr:hypothetical protein [Labilithrix sp.]MCW5831041.1 hypothetical protein [Labilithrix sp.]